MTENGILIVNKPGGMTSHDVVDRFRSILKERRIGHTGTLDPDTRGVLVLAVGKGTKVIPFLPLDEKEYRAEIILGISTDTHDASGRRIGADRSDKMPDEGLLSKVLEGFEGVIEQVPPMVSALKFKGKRLYQLAREGVEVPRQPRRVNIHEIELLEYEPPRVRLRIVCSAGTYVRSLARDLGEALQTGAHLSGLVRLRVGPYNIDDALSQDDWIRLKQAEFRKRAVIPLERALEHLPVWVAPEYLCRSMADGQTVSPTDKEGAFPDMPDGLVTVHLNSGGLMAVGEKVTESSGKSSVRPVRVLQRFA